MHFYTMCTLQRPIQNIINRYIRQYNNSISNQCCNLLLYNITTTIRLQHTTTQRHKQQRISRIPADPKVQAAYHILEINYDATITEIRHSYFQLAKKLHPDSIDKTTADATIDAQTKFTAVIRAYEILKEYKANEQNEVNEWLQFADDIKQHTGDSPQSQNMKNIINHKLPQSRHYLSNEGVGYGPSPFQREKQYNTYKVERAVDNVGNYNLHKLEKDLEKSQQDQTNHDSKLQQHNISAQDVLQLIRTLEQQNEDRTGSKKSRNVKLDEAIKQSMEDWDSSEYHGRKLNHDTLDTGDALTNKLNAILARNGHIPEWLRLERQIVLNYDAACQQLLYHWNHIQYADPAVILQEIEAEQIKQRKEQEETELAWETARKNGKSNNSKLQKQLASELLNDRYGSTTSYNTLQDTYLYSDHIHHTLDEHNNCMYCVAWKRAVVLSHNDLKRISRMTDDFNLQVPIASRQRMHYLLQNLVADVTTYVPQLSVPQHDKAEYTSQYRVYPRTVDEVLDDTSYMNRQQVHDIHRSVYNKSAVQTAVAATVSIVVVSVGTLVGIVKYGMNKQATKLAIT